VTRARARANGRRERRTTSRGDAREGNEWQRWERAVGLTMTANGRARRR